MAKRTITATREAPSARPEISRLSIVAQVARLIREDVLDLPDGSLFGTEEELIARYGVSRPTLREAVGLVIQEQLLVARRGIGGGFFVRRPDAQLATHALALYLRAHKVGMLELMQATHPIRVEIVRLATAAEDEETRTAIAELLEKDRRTGEGVEFEEFLRTDRAFNMLLAKRSGSRILSLFCEIMLDLASMVHRESDIFRGDRKKLETYRAAQRQLAKAVLEGDERVAMREAQRNITEPWIRENQERDAAADKPKVKAKRR